MASSNAGIRISQAGTSVQYAADYQFVFNSDWPSLQTVFDQTITLTTAQAWAHITVPHNLGFFPVAFAYVSVAGNLLGRDGLNNFSPVFFRIGKSGFYFVPDGNNNYTVNIKAYNIDLTQQIDYTLPRPPVIKTKYDPTMGIKVAKYGASIASNDLRDFILHSRAQSPAVLSVVTQKSDITNSGIIKYKNPAGYVPWIYGFTTTSSLDEPFVYIPASFAIQAAGLTINPPNTTLGYDVAYKGATLVVLRDPLIIANQLQVTY